MEIITLCVAGQDGTSQGEGEDKENIDGEDRPRRRRPYNNRRFNNPRRRRQYSNRSEDGIDDGGMRRFECTNHCLVFV